MRPSRIGMRAMIASGRADCEIILMRYQLCILLVLLALAGCRAKLVADPLDQLKPGMTANEVMALLGEPTAKGEATREEWQAKAKATQGNESHYNCALDFRRIGRLSRVGSWNRGVAVRPKPIPAAKGSRDTFWIELEFDNAGKLVYAHRVLNEFPGTP